MGEHLNKNAFGLRASVGRKKMEIVRGGGHRIGNKGEFWWDYAGL